MLLNQAPDSDEELEIDDDTKIILIDKQVNYSLLLFLLSSHFHFSRILGMTVMTQITHLVVQLLQMITRPRG